jgi:hypothetical protein
LNLAILDYLSSTNLIIGRKNKIIQKNNGTMHT